MPKSRLLPTLSALFAVVIWGGTFIATKIALKEVSPATIVWIRFGIGVIVLGITVLSRKQFALVDLSSCLHGFYLFVVC